LGDKDLRQRRTKRKAKESVLVIRSRVVGLAQSLEEDARQGAALLDEHIGALGSACPPEILDSRDAIRVASRSVGSLLEDVQDCLTRLYYSQ
jgi:hypothetical protein